MSKQPNLNRYFGGSFSLGNASMQRFTGDVNLPLARLGLGERTAFRMNFLVHDAGVSGRNVVENERWGFAPSLMFGSGSSTRLTLSYYRIRQDNMPDYGIPWVTATQNVLSAYRDQPAPVPRETFYGLKSRDTERMGSGHGDSPVRARLQRWRYFSQPVPVRAIDAKFDHYGAALCQQRHAGDQPQRAFLDHRRRHLGQPG